MHKRSFSISGHRTSLALEIEFWTALEAMATARGLSLPALITEIDSTREVTNLSSAVRLAILSHYRQNSEPD